MPGAPPLWPKLRTPPSNRVLEAVSVLSAPWRLHLARGEQGRVLRVQQDVARERGGESQQVADGGVAAAGRRAAIGQRAGVQHPGAVLLHVAIGASGNGHVLRLRPAGGHACGLEDVVAHVVVVALPGHLLDNRAEQQEAVVAVPPTSNPARTRGRARHRASRSRPGFSTRGGARRTRARRCRPCRRCASAGDGWSPSWPRRGWGSRSGTSREAHRASPCRPAPAA